MRLLDIKHTNLKIYKKDGKVDAYREASDNITKLHSKANKVTQNQFRNRFLCMSVAPPDVSEADQSAA